MCGNTSATSLHVSCPPRHDGVHCSVVVSIPLPSPVVAVPKSYEVVSHKVEEEEEGKVLGVVRIGLTVVRTCPMVVW